MVGNAGPRVSPKQCLQRAGFIERAKAEAVRRHQAVMAFQKCACNIFVDQGHGIQRGV